MAQFYVGVDRGADYNPDALTTGSSTTAGLDIELRMDVAAGWTTVELEAVLDAIERYIFQFRPNQGV
jgi:hypothetical protein